ncbi:FtsK/SpoIIIE domain-containing protein [Tissierella creatinophila]|uniref:DNA translocase FtsK n=1 Tax=Tissierella creatinophila DSM 6911 TaxID=1123403 RepID=A0A1U7M6E2_TISCR|nr:FtsK/SpoIIIE domain-containing protein [Tissierella creatinophila]OLS02867.1 DNA translocase FtsK [Tissierella creatinophila DSM 6911]
MKKNNEVELFGLCLVLGIGTVVAGGDGVQVLGYGLSTLGASMLGFSLINNANPYNNLFRALKLEINDRVPKFLERKETNYGYCLTFRLLAGMSTDDFEKKKLAIEQHLNRKIEITYNNWRIFIKVYEKQLEELIPYEFSKCKGILEFNIGKVLGDKTLNLDLEKAVHLLIAGETGSGKSTLVRSIITNIVLSRRKVSLHLIDLKNGAEFNLFRKSNIVKTFSRNIDEAEVVLENLIEEVNKRYDLFFENDVVDIREYNKLKNIKKLDYQICIIDEFADLQNEKGSISSVEVLAAKARACGVHLIISTQRPDSKILNGRIKANIPCVIGLKTMNSLNSRIIIDEDGLEKLRGRGHGLLRYGNLTEFQSMFLEVVKARELIKHTYIEKEIKREVKEEIGKLDNLDFIKDLGVDIDDSN